MIVRLDAHGDGMCSAAAHEASWWRLERGDDRIELSARPDAGGSGSTGVG